MNPLKYWDSLPEDLQEKIITYTVLLVAFVFVVAGVWV